MVDIVISQVLVRFDEPTLNGLGQDFFLVEAAAVVAHLNHYTAGIMIGIELNRTLGGFTSGKTHIGRLDAMIQGVTHQMRERITNFFHYGSIQLSFGTVDSELDIFAQLFADIAYHALETIERTANFH